MTAARDVASSRPLGVAKGLGSSLLDEAVIFSRPVILTGEREILASQNGRWCLLNSLRLLSRIVGPLTVVLPPGLGAFEMEVRQLAARVWSKGSVNVVGKDEPVAVDSAAAVLNVGTQVDPRLPWTAINSNGWVARVSSGPTPLPPDCSQSNPFAALMAASLGVAEVFKRIYSVPRDAAPLLDATQFSLFELSTEPTSLGPLLPIEISLPDTVMVGAGAIGNGIALLLSQLAVRGRLHIIDKQDYGRENLGTCTVLDDESWLGTSKAERLAAWLERPDGLRCTPERAWVADARSGKFVRGMSVELVLNGLDDIGARHDAQMLWPSVLVDGGINAVGAAVVVHRLDRPHGACMRCSFRLPVEDERKLQAKATGLSMTSLDSDLGRPLTQQDVSNAEESERAWLSEQLTQGKTVCATISEAQSRLLGMDIEEGFNPSVPFVATVSAALVLTQALKALLYPEAEFTQRFQMESVFIGPESSLGVLTRADPTCECVVHRRLIDRVAAARRLRQAAAGPAVPHP
ncbi:MAG TPA: ThiF family adenylyltransferase [Variovorax sp.]|nr:ThiF family adenylyltransferase [Variovorax sp.]